MTKVMLPALLATALFSLPAAAEISPGVQSAIITSVVSGGSSLVVSGILMSPVLLPAMVVTESVEHSKADKDATVITGKTDKKEDVTLLVATEKLNAHPVKPGDKLTLEAAEKGAGAYLKKDGEVISHMVTQDDANLSHQKKMP